ncbi:hypothetical protein D2E76_16410 [Mycobacteroides abscessus]|uniref:Uncharacterized protein n=1 Tax=Mycobacteroides abscessus TaxID=36809 RepID=A0ABD7HLU5_9MYCO|nr:hypothetical protein [Mycobacteroides abscessus]RIT36834.1 hypothetical protein D2E76_16410 [Mycobacteroides abscessus]
MSVQTPAASEIARHAEEVVATSSNADEVLLARRVLAECGVGPYRAAVYPTAEGTSCTPLWVSELCTHREQAMSEASAYLTESSPESISLAGVPGSRGQMKKVMENGVHIANVILEGDGTGYAEQTACSNREVDRLLTRFQSELNQSAIDQTVRPVKESTDG